MKLKARSKGFTLVEVVVTLAIVAILSAIMIPLISSNIKSARFAKAGADVDAIKDAIVKFRFDTAKWPVYNNASVYHDLLYGEGTRTSTWEAATTKLSLHSSLVTMPTLYNPGPSRDGTPVWNGPYMGQVKADPWGNAYLVNSIAFTLGANNRVWVLSAGADRLVSTLINGTTDPPAGDDVYEYLK